MKLSQVKNKYLLWLGLAVIIYIAVFFTLSYFKFIYHAYNALDLAIFNQTFFNTSYGNLFGLTIHPHSYLGDHFVPLIALLSPLYALWRSPLNILLWQTVILALSVIPLYLIGKKILNKKLLFIFLIGFLLCPFIQNTNLFEFHALAFLPFLFLFAFYFYQQKNFKLFLLFFVLCLLIREDVALIMFMFAIVALIEKRSIKWIITPIFISAMYFLLAMVLIKTANPYGSYKFLVYYSWLGNNIPEILQTIFTQPWLVIKHILAGHNIILVLGLLVGTWLLPILKPKYLLFCIPSLLQIILGSAKNSALILETHYSILFLPGLLLAGMYGLSLLSQPASDKNSRLDKLRLFLKQEKYLGPTILVICFIYAAAFLGPLYSGYKDIKNGFFVSKTKQLEDHLLQQIPKESPTATTYNYLAALSSRPFIYSLHYAYIGHTQFAQRTYKLPNNTEYLVIDFSDILLYDIQFENNIIFTKHYPRAAELFNYRLNSLDLYPVEVVDSLSLWKKNPQHKISLIKKDPPIEKQLAGPTATLDNVITFLGYLPRDEQPHANLNLDGWNFVPLSLYFKTNQTPSNNYHLLVEVADQNSQPLVKKIYPLGYGLYPTSYWQPGETLSINYNLLLPKINAPEKYQLLISLVYPRGGAELNGLRSATLNIDEEETLGPKINLGSYNNFQ